MKVIIITSLTSPASIVSAPFFLIKGSQDQIKKLVVFENELIKFLENPQSNGNIYRFALEKGISIAKTNEVLRSLENRSYLTFTGTERRKGAFYLDFQPQKEIFIKAKWQQQK